MQWCQQGRHQPSGSARMRSLAIALADFQHTLNGNQREVRKEASCALGKTDRMGLQKGKYFQEKFL